MANIFSSFLVAVIGPLYGYFVLGVKTTTTDMRIPFADEGSNDEFIWNLLLQSTIAFHAILLYFGLEVFMALF